MSYLQIEHVSHLFFNKQGFTKALENVDCRIEEGEFVSILGPSGCGKSTLLSILAGITEETFGQISLEQKPLKQSKEKIGYMLQQDYLFPWKTIIDNILLGPKVQKEPLSKAEEKAHTLLEEVGLPDISHQYPNSLSGGMRQRVALVRTLINDPSIFLLDEPFSALDYFTKLKLEDLVSNILREYKKTTILVTHDIGEAISMSDRIFILSKQPGKLIETIEIPIELRNETPFLSRRHPKYQNIFDKVWGIMNRLEQKDSRGKEGTT